MSVGLMRRNTLARARCKTALRVPVSGGALGKRRSPGARREPGARIPPRLLGAAPPCPYGDARAVACQSMMRERAREGEGEGERKSATENCQKSILKR